MNKENKNEFIIKGDFIELIKLLKALGLCENGAAAKTIVDENKVLVNNALEKRYRAKLLKGTKVTVNEVDYFVI